mmetsp:Transcript_8006/g.14230  ORF Transcript_8006/g.14230 Transcript_8006/m.14230 type:complete len:1248 (-) Transcript_8006:149-3892(-)|eukprot:CAMPEP_0184708176 /NCGR_PEP_ID=MMETSP0313-20130426/37642_1 /TAXON_ID=2792 /ORGANISM="Porphyridium aerugineum, Strain SAG 1380-2" /LENGTH=1247 /DNA_ID=CAMNT_0027169759 /DNA_START=248 /DNA_END=3991 /DNA_ORIENTATION=-
MDENPSENAAPAADLLELRIKQLDSSEHVISISPASSILELKQRIETSLNVPVTSQRLIYRGRVLRDESAIREYNMESGHVVHLVVRAHPAPTNADTSAHANNPAAAPPSGVPPTTAPTSQPSPGMQPRLHVHTAVVQNIGAPSQRGANNAIRSMHELTRFLQGALQSFGVPPDAAMRGAVAGAASTLTASSRVERRQTGRNELIDTIWSAIEHIAHRAAPSLVATLPPRPTAPMGDAESMRLLFQAFITILRDESVVILPTETARTAINTLASNPQDQDARRQLADLSTHLTALGNVLATLNALTASIAGNGELGTAADVEAASAVDAAGVSPNANAASARSAPTSGIPQGILNIPGITQVGPNMFRVDGQAANTPAQNAGPGVPNQPPFSLGSILGQVMGQVMSNAGTAMAGTGLSPSPPPPPPNMTGAITNPGYGPNATNFQVRAGGVQQGLQGVLQSLGPLVANIATAAITSSMNNRQPQNPSYAQQPIPVTTAAVGPGIASRGIPMNPNVDAANVGNQAMLQQPAAPASNEGNRGPPPISSDVSSSDSDIQMDVTIGLEGADGTAYAEFDIPSGGNSDTLAQNIIGSILQSIAGQSMGRAAQANMGPTTAGAFDGAVPNAGSMGVGVATNEPVSIAQLIRNMALPQDGSNLERFFFTAFEHLTVSEGINIFNGNLQPLSRVRVPLRDFVVNEFLHGDQSEESIRRAVNELVSGDVSSTLATLTQMPNFVSRRRSNLIFEPRVTISGILERRLTEFVGILLNPMVSNDDFPERSVMWLDHTTGEISYSLANMCNNGWSDASVIVQAWFMYFTQILGGPEFGMMLSFAGSIVLGYITGSYNRWVQRVVSGAIPAATAYHPPASQPAVAVAVAPLGTQTAAPAPAIPEVSPRIGQLGMTSGTEQQHDPTPMDVEVPQTQSTRPVEAEPVAPVTIPQPVADNASPSVAPGEQAALAVAVAADANDEFDDLASELIEEMEHEKLGSQENHKSLDEPSNRSEPKPSAAPVAEQSKSSARSVATTKRAASSAFQPGRVLNQASRPKPSLSFASSSVARTSHQGVAAGSSSSGAATTASVARERQAPAVSPNKNNILSASANGGVAVDGIPEFRSALLRSMPDTESDRWAGILEADVEAQNGLKRRPLSRAYRSGNPGSGPLSSSGSEPQPFTPQVAGHLASGALRKAMEQTRIPPETISAVCKEIDASHSEFGAKYLEELEKSIASRLEYDPDYEPESFPYTSKRFRPK